MKAKRRRSQGAGRRPRTDDPTYPRTVRLTDKEYQAQRERAEKQGMDWSEWVRQRLAPEPCVEHGEKYCDCDK